MLFVADQQFMNQPKLQKTDRWKSCAFLLFIVALFSFLGSCSKPNRDVAITKDIQAMLSLRPELKNADIVVLVRNGNVTLRGNVPSETARNALEKTARQEPGVLTIDDQTSINATANKR
jgi:hypothetical protein